MPFSSLSETKSKVMTRLKLFIGKRLQTSPVGLLSQFRFVKSRGSICSPRMDFSGKLSLRLYKPYMWTRTLERILSQFSRHRKALEFFCSSCLNSISEKISYDASLVDCLFNVEFYETQHFFYIIEAFFCSLVHSRFRHTERTNGGGYKNFSIEHSEENIG